jgi:hypothetical protein
MSAESHSRRPQILTPIESYIGPPCGRFTLQASVPLKYICRKTTPRQPIGSASKHWNAL